MKNSTTIRNLFIFSGVVVLIGWGGVWVDSLLPPQAEEETLGMAIWLAAPLLLVIFLRTFGGDGWRDAGLKPNFQGKFVWYAVAFLIFPAVTSVNLLLGYILGWVDFTGFNMPQYFSIFASLLLVNILKNVFEESVWRGYLAAKLIQLKLSDFRIYLISGVIWGVWHAPYYLVFLPDEALQTVLPVGKLTFTFVAIVNIAAWTVMFVEIFRLTGSVWSVVLLHAVEDALINHLVIDGYIAILSGTEFIISPIVGIVPTTLFLAVGLLLRHQRLLANPLSQIP